MCKPWLLAASRQKPEASLSGGSKLAGCQITSLAGVQEGGIPTAEGEMGIDVSPQDRHPLCAAEGNIRGSGPGTI